MSSQPTIATVAWVDGCAEARLVGRVTMLAPALVLGAALAATAMGATLPGAVHAIFTAGAAVMAVVGGAVGLDEARRFASYRRDR